VKSLTIISIALLIFTQACSRQQRSGSVTSSTKRISSQQISPIAHPLKLEAIRPYLTSQLRMDEAERLFGPSGSPILVSGYFYQQWLVDDSNILSTAFSLDTKRLQRAFVKSPNGEVIEHVLDIRKR